MLHVIFLLVPTLGAPGEEGEGVCRVTRVEPGQFFTCVSAEDDASGNTKGSVEACRKLSSESPGKLTHRLYANIFVNKHCKVEGEGQPKVFLSGSIDCSGPLPLGLLRRDVQASPSTESSKWMGVVAEEKRPGLTVRKERCRLLVSCLLEGSTRPRDSTALSPAECMKTVDEKEEIQKEWDSELGADVLKLEDGKFVSRHRGASFVESFIVSECSAVLYGKEEGEKDFLYEFSVAFRPPVEAETPWMQAFSWAVGIIVPGIMIYIRLNQKWKVRAKKKKQ